MDGKYFPFSDLKIAATAPPFHSRCRGCTAPYFDNDVGERDARSADCNVYYVPDNMNFAV